MGIASAPGHLHDVVVSYSSIDRAWVEKFVSDLQKAISQYAGRSVPIWWDRQNIGPGDDWNEKMLEDARRSRVFVPVVSPSWLHSDPCQRELAAFRQTAEPESLFPVVLLPLDPHPEPPEIRKATQANFYQKVQGAPQFLKGQPREREIHRLAHAIAARLGPASLPVQSSTGIDGVVAATRERIAPQILEKCGWMRILNMSQRIDASQIYTEVNIFEHVRAKRLRSIKEIQEEPKLEDFQTHTTLKRIPGKEALQRHPRLMILGKPGAGKTTFLRRLAVEVIRGEYRSDLVPAYLEFRSLNGKPILDALQELWEIDPWIILKAGRGLLLLDGLDELPASYFEAIRRELDQLLTRDARSPVLVTCRIAAREYVSERFNEIEIAEFTSEQIEYFARNWFPARGYPNKVPPFLRSMTTHSGVRDLAKSPLLLTMICLYFEEHQDLNVSRADLYRKGLETILERWDATRDIKRESSPYGQLSTSARESLYSTVAVRHFERGEAVFPAPDVAEFFSKPEETNSILQDMEAQHGLLIQRAQGVYSFSHLTFQEYLTAKHFVEDSDPERWNRLLPHLPDLRWREVFLLVTSMVSADYLLQRMQAWLNNLISAQPAIQELLRWAQSKAALQRTYKPAAVRSLCLSFGQVTSIRRLVQPDEARAFDLDRTRACARVLARAVDITRDLDHNLDIARDLSLALDPDRDLALDLARTSANARIRTLGRTLDLTLNQAFLRDLEQLRTLDKDNKVDARWFDSLQQTMIKQRDLDYDFPLSATDFEYLGQYESGHQVLIACLKSERVSPAIRARIEGTLFLPASDPLPEANGS